MKILFPLFLLAVWLIWIPACVWGRAAKGDFGGTSILPVVPFYPLVAWALSAILDWLHPNVGVMLIGSLHVLLLLFFVDSALRSLHAIRKQKHKSNVA